ncbi:MAG: galactokinase [Bacteroidota bacterium]
MNLLQTLAQRYAEIFKQSYILIKAPGRINVIGEHTDYNEGWVLPAAIDKYIYFALGKNGDRNYTEVYSPFFDEKAKFSIQATDFEDIPSWAKYLQAATMEMRARGYDLKGINGAMDGDIPLGAGLSSSAALCCGFIFGMAKLNDIEISRAEIALIAQATEHRVGLNCGLMDQYAVLFGKENQVIGLDCQSLQFEHSPLELQNYVLVLINSNIKHELAADSGYNDRRASCERVVATIQKKHPNIKTLRDISEAQLLDYQSQLDAIDFQRAQYIFRENQRVLNTMEALKKGNLQQVGEYLYQSHHGMRHEYEITVPEIDLLVDLTKEMPEVLGSRMMGGGFGGCTINFIEKSAKERIIQEIVSQYQQQTNQEATVYEVKISDGVSLI